MNIDSSFILIKLLVDFGLVVLIWMVQLIIYPGFLYLERQLLLEWHEKYTRAITYIVAPLMCVQLLLASYAVFWVLMDAYNIAYFALVLLTWLLTMVLFVPVHNRISYNTYTEADLQKLVSRNWWRVLVWVIILVLEILKLKN